MSAYVIAQIQVHDHDAYRRYVAGFRATFGDFRGAVLVADDNVEVVEGCWPYTRTAVIRFEDADERRRWYHSEGYQAALRHREAGASTNLVFAEGLDR